MSGIAWAVSEFSERAHEWVLRGRGMEGHPLARQVRSAVSECPSSERMPEQ